MKLFHVIKDKDSILTVIVNYDTSEQCVDEVIRVSATGNIADILTNIGDFDKWIDMINWREIYSDIIHEKNNPHE